MHTCTVAIPDIHVVTGGPNVGRHFRVEGIVLSTLFTNHYHTLQLLILFIACDQL